MTKGRENALVCSASGRGQWERRELHHCGEAGANRCRRNMLSARLEVVSLCSTEYIYLQAKRGSAGGCCFFLSGLSWRSKGRWWGDTVPCFPSWLRSCVPAFLLPLALLGSSPPGGHRLRIGRMLYRWPGLARRKQLHRGSRGPSASDYTRPSFRRTAPVTLSRYRTVSCFSCTTVSSVWLGLLYGSTAALFLHTTSCLLPSREPRSPWPLFGPLSRAAPSTFPPERGDTKELAPSTASRGRSLFFFLVSSRTFHAPGVR